MSTEIQEENSPLVSVIMNCFNSEQFLKQALKSVLSQTYKNWEIIFWDNASTDSSAAIVKECNDDRIRYYRSAETEPLGQARNHALKEVSGKYITFLDCDDLWIETKLEKQIKKLEENRKIDFLYSNFFALQGKTEAVVYKLGNKLPSGQITGKLLVRYRLNLQTVMFKRDLLDKVNEWFDPSLELCEEMELFIRLSMIANFYYLEEPLVKYRIHGDQFTVTKFDRFYEEKSYIINKLCDLYEGFKTFYSKEIQSYKATMMIDKSTDLILQNDKPAARQLLVDMRFKKLKVLIFWLMSFLPLPTYLLVNKVIGRSFIMERYNFLNS